MTYDGYDKGTKINNMVTESIQIFNRDQTTYFLNIISSVIQWYNYEINRGWVCVIFLAKFWVGDNSTLSPMSGGFGIS